MRLRLVTIVLALAWTPAFAQPDRVTYAKQCAAELGPIPEFNCLNGTELPITVKNKRQKITVLFCDKPVQLGLHFGKQCVPFARIQELKTGKADVLTLALCRKYFDRPHIPAKGNQPAIKPEDNPFFDDIAIIQHDRTTGRTCFFQSNVSGQKTDRGIDGSKVPSPSDPSATIWMSTSHIRDSVECTKCHAADAFVWSPYIAQSVDVGRWDPNGRYDSNFADLFGKPATTFRPDNNECLDCHRFGRGPKPKGDPKDDKDFACNGLVHDYVRRDKPNALKPTEYWMPPEFGTNRVEFDKTYKSSIAQIDRCCADPSRAECRSDVADGRIPHSLFAEVWRANGPACGGSACWQNLDLNPNTRALAADDATLYQLHDSGAIWRSTGAECAGTSCAGWTPLDGNPNAVAIAAGAGALHQLHRNGTIWRFPGTPCGAVSCPGWVQLGDDSNTVAIAMGDIQLYRLDSDGAISSFTGPACSTSGCPGWRLLDKNPATVAIAAAPEALYQLHDNGMIWRYTGTPCSAGGCTGWQQLDFNPRTTAIAAAPGALYQLHDDGSIWRYIGVPCFANACAGWVMLDNTPTATAIAASGNNLYQLRADGSVWRHTGVPCIGAICSGWTQLDNDPKTTALIAGGDLVYQIRQEQGGLRRAERRPRPLGMAAARPR